MFSNDLEGFHHGWLVGLDVVQHKRVAFEAIRNGSSNGAHFVDKKVAELVTQILAIRDVDTSAVFLIAGVQQLVSDAPALTWIIRRVHKSLGYMIAE